MYHPTFQLLSLSYFSVLFKPCFLISLLPSWKILIFRTLFCPQQSAQKQNEIFRNFLSEPSAAEGCQERGQSRIWPSLCTDCRGWPILPGSTHPQLPIWNSKSKYHRRSSPKSSGSVYYLNEYRSLRALCNDQIPSWYQSDLREVELRIECNPIQPHPQFTTKISVKMNDAERTFEQSQDIVNAFADLFSGDTFDAI